MSAEQRLPTCMHRVAWPTRAPTNGGIHCWCLPQAKLGCCWLDNPAGPVKGIAVAPSGEVAVSCSTDCSVRLFRLPFAPFATPGPVEDEASAVLEFQGRNAFRGIDHHWTRNTFGTAGAQVLGKSQNCSCTPVNPRH